MHKHALQTWNALTYAWSTLRSIVVTIFWSKSQCIICLAKHYGWFCIHKGWYWFGLSKVVNLIKKVENNTKYYYILAKLSVPKVIKQ